MFDQPFGFKPPDRLPDRSAADLEPRGDLRLGQAGAGAELAGPDFLSQRIGRGLG